MKEQKKLGLPTVIATGSGMIVATSCLLSLGQGAGASGTAFIIAMVVACAINICSALSMAELNALMPNLTGGLAQYTLACMGPFASLITMVGGYLVCNIIVGSVESTMFGNTMSSVLPTSLPSAFYSSAMLVILMLINMGGINFFAKIQDIVAYALIASMLVMGLLGIFGLGSGQTIEQPALAGQVTANSTLGMVGLAFFLFIGSEFIIPIAKDVKKARRNVPLGMSVALMLVLFVEVLVVLGMHRYAAWADLAASDTPHVLYGTLLLGPAGTYWMAAVSLFAVISTANSVINSLSYIFAGMGRIGLLPEFFCRKNSKGAPWVGILFTGCPMLILIISGLTNTSQLTFFILTGCVFWMIAYAVSCINVLILRKRLPKAPRTFKVPFGPVIPVAGLIGTLLMIWYIDPDISVKLEIYKFCAITFVILAVYAILWTKFRMKKPLFKPVPMEVVMAMENEKYLEVRKEARIRRKLEAGITVPN